MSTILEDLQSNKRGTLPRAQRNTLGIYHDGGRTLFVPTELMWKFHDASGPSAICKRAGLGRSVYYNWHNQYGKDHPEFLDWLFNSTANFPEILLPERERKLVGQSLRKRGGPTDDMLRFRAQATIPAICRAVFGQEGNEKQHLVRNWRTKRQRKYPDEKWMDGWIMRGQSPPKHVGIVTADVRARATIAWNFAPICREAGVKPHAYVDWIRQGTICRIGLLKWLYGWPAPPRTFVIDQKLERLRTEMTRNRIAKVIGRAECSYWSYLERSDQWKSVLEAVFQAKKSKAKYSPPAWFDSNNKKHTRVLNSITALADASTLSACCQRAGMEMDDYYEACKKAKRLGVEQDLDDFLHGKGKYPKGKSPNSATRRFGLLSENFFRPHKGMLDFLEIAKTKMTEQHIHSLQVLPCLDQWFEDWAMPLARNGRRLTLHQMAVEPRDKQPNQNGKIENLTVGNLTVDKLIETGNQKRTRKLRKDPKAPSKEAGPRADTPVTSQQKPDWMLQLEQEHPDHSIRPARTKPYKQETMEMSEVLHDFFISRGQSKADALKQAQNRYPRVAPKHVDQVKKTVKRYANYWVPPLSLHRKPN